MTKFINDFFNAIENNEVDLAKAIASNLKESNELDGDDAPIYQMIGWNCLQGYKILIDAGTNLNFIDKYGDMVLMDVILQVNSDYLPLTERQALEYLEYALQKGANPNLMGTNIQTPLHRAALEGYVKVGKLLLEYGADINIIEQDDEQYTPLLLSIKHNRFSFAKMLVEEGADIHLRTALRAKTPLQMFNVQNKDELLIELNNRIKM